MRLVKKNVKSGVFLLLVFMCSACAQKIQSAYLTADQVKYENHTSGADKKQETPCHDFMNYAPVERYPDHTPTRYVRVNFQIINNKEGTSSFNPEEGIVHAKQLIEQTNKALQNNQKMTLPVGNNTPVLPIKTQFVLVDKPDGSGEPAVYVHYDDDEYHYKKGKKYNIYSKTVFDKYATQAGEVLNIFLMEHHPDSIISPTYKASRDGVGFSEWVKVVGAYQNRDRGVVGIFKHEVGHTFGLSHTWNANDGCEDTPRNPGCWDQFSDACRETGIYSNNMMDYNNCQCALTPCQLGKIHYTFARENSSQRKLLVPTWCEYNPQATIQIGLLDNVVWKSAKDLEGDIVINNGGKLTIQCEVSLPKGAKIIIKPKGTLIVDGGKILNKCGDEWDGIEVLENKKNKGAVIFSNEPELLNMANPINSEKKIISN